MSNMNTAIAKHVSHADAKSFGVIFTLGFTVLLPIALMGQLLGWHWRSWLPGAEGVKSIFGGVKAAVYTFMSYLT